MTFSTARDLAKEAQRLAGAAAGHTDDQAIKFLSAAVAKLAESQAELADEMRANE